MVACWRRDSSLWARSPIHRYAQHPLRVRCFSKKGFQAAQHRDGRNGRPSSLSGLSNLEWAQLHHCRRWKRRLEEDPYRALFGASEDMLKGKGLKSWEWAFRSFPRWMVDEVVWGKTREREENQDTSEQKQEDRIKTPKMSRTSDGKEYPKRVDVAGDSGPTERKPLFPEPSFRSSRPPRTQHDVWGSGVESPSDPRRVREHRMPETSVGNYADGLSHDASTPEKVVSTPAPPATINLKPPLLIDAEEAKNLSNSQEQHEDTNSIYQSFLASKSPPETNNTATPDALVRETSCFEELFPDKSGSSPSWKQPALDRMPARPSLDGYVAPKMETSVPITDPTLSSHGLHKRAHGEHTDYLGSDSGASTRMPRLTSENSISGDHSTRVGDEWFVEPDLSTEQVLREFPGFGKVPNPRKSIADRLRSLPEDDLDLLSASDIRASMGRAKSLSQGKGISRQQLEESFESLRDNETELPPMDKARILNDHQARRKQKELKQVHDEEAQKGTKRKNTNPENSPGGVSVYLSRTKAMSMLDKALDDMSRWLEAGGAIRGRSDQAEDSLFAKISKVILLGQQSTARIRKELVSDIPAVQQLLLRLRSTEANILFLGSWDEHSRFKSHRPPNRIQSSTRKARSRRRYLSDLYSVGEAYQQACNAIDELSSTIGSSEALNIRLRQAVELLDKNIRLISMLAFGLQLPAATPPRGNYTQQKLRLARHLLTLHETQVAIRRLAERMVLISGSSARATITPEVRTGGEVASSSVEQITNAGSKAATTSPNKGVDKEPVNDTCKTFHGPTVDHPTTSLGETTSTTEPHDSGAAPSTYQMLKEDEISPTVAVSDPSIILPKRPVDPAQPALRPFKTDEDATTVMSLGISNPTDSIAMSTTTSSQPSIDQPGEHQTVLTSSDTKYTIYTYDPQDDEIILTTYSATPTPHSYTESIPLHTALATLTHPSKFLPHLPPNSTIVVTKPDMLVVRPAPGPTFTTTRVAASETDSSSVKDGAEVWKGINPIDGTARLSPTGFVGDGLDLEQDFEERRRAAGEYHGKRRVEEESSGRGERKERRGGGVMKMAIVAAATCYIVGVVAEIVR